VTKAQYMRVREVGASKCCAVMVQIKAKCLIPKGSRLPTGTLLREIYSKTTNEETAKGIHANGLCIRNYMDKLERH
jgi:hypothetical protein